MKLPFSFQKAGNGPVLVMAVLAAIVLFGFVVLIRFEAERLVDTQIESQARAMSEAIRSKLDAEIRKFPRPDDPAAWAQADPEIEDHYLGFPNLTGMTVKNEKGLRLALIGPSPASIPPPVTPGPDGALAVTVGTRQGNRIPVASAFQIRGVTVEVRLLFDMTTSVFDAFNGFVIFWVCIVGLLVYALAILSWLVREAQFRSESRSRDRFVRLRAIGEVAAGLAHEIRNPLNAIHLSVQVIERALRRGETDPRERDFARIGTEVGKIRKVADSFVRFTRVGDLVLSELDLAHMARERVDSIRTASDGRVEFKLASKDSLLIEGDREKLGEALSALLQYAMERALTADPPAAVAVELVPTKEGATLTVVDGAAAPHEDEVRQILDPVLASRADGSGVALAMVRTVVECHGGSFNATPGASRGLILRVDLPRRC